MDSCILWAVEWRVEVEVGEVGCCSLGVRRGECAVDDHFDGFERRCLGPAVANVVDGVATNGDASAVWIGFGGAHVADNASVGNIRDAVAGDVPEVDGVHAVGSGNALGIRLSGMPTHALAQATDFAGV